MTDQAPIDELDRVLRGMAVYDAGADMAARTRARCLAALVARGASRPGRGARVAGRLAWLEPAVALGFGGLFLTAAVWISIAFLRALQ